MKAFAAGTAALGIWLAVVGSPEAPPAPGARTAAETIAPAAAPSGLSTSGFAPVSGLAGTGPGGPTGLPRSSTAAPGCSLGAVAHPASASRKSITVAVNSLLMCVTSRALKSFR